MTKNTQELVSALGLPSTVCNELLAQVALNICPEPRSVTECISAKETETRFLPTGLCAFDATLRGGLPCGGITEVVGPAGAGKTQFCLQSCVRAIGEWDANSAIYVDTVCATCLHPGECLRKSSAPNRAVSVSRCWQESRFSPDRLLEIASHLFPNLSQERLNKIAERCIVFTVQSTAELMTTLQQLEDVCSPYPPTLHPPPLRLPRSKFYYLDIVLRSLLCWPFCSESDCRS
jgi:hypothetical protein